MRRCLLGLVPVLFLGGCVADVLPAGVPVDVADFTLWQTRGTTVGRIAQRYCVAGSERQRAWMREAIDLQSFPATVTITCPKGVPT